MTAALVMDPVYAGSNVADALLTMAAVMPDIDDTWDDPGLWDDGGIWDGIFLGLGLQLESAAIAPPRITWDEDDRLSKGCDFNDPSEQLDDGHAYFEAREHYMVRCWGASRAQADDLRDAQLNALLTLGSRHWSFELGKAFPKKPKVLRQGFAWEIEVALYVPIRFETYPTANAATTKHGQIVATINPVDPTPEAIPGMV